MQIDRNKNLAAELNKYLPDKRDKLNAGTINGIKRSTGFSNVEIFRKYLWYLLRERTFDQAAVDDMVALKVRCQREATICSVYLGFPPKHLITVIKYYQCSSDLLDGILICIYIMLVILVRGSRHSLLPCLCDKLTASSSRCPRKGRRWSDRRRRRRSPRGALPADL